MLFLVANLILTFPILKFGIICLLTHDLKSQNDEEHPTDIRNEYKGFHMLRIFKHISIAGL
jgi:hypothetical protein